MKLKIGRKIKADEIKRNFNSEYRYLKIEFINKTSERGDFILPRSCYLCEIKELRKDGEIGLHPWQSVKEVKQLFLDQFNLTIKVYSRIKYNWIEITTETETLRDLNKKGREFLNAFYDEFNLL
ncbi:MAG: hypothetical protein ACJ748_05460 [Flavisolibacter sp.]|jgi:hypothetical protein